MNEEVVYTPTWDETKLGATKFRKLVDLYREAKARADEATEAADEYKNQIAALQIKYKVDACRVDDAVCRWVPPGQPGKKFSMERALSAGIKPAVLEKCFEPTAPRAAYFQVYLPRPKGSVD